MDSRHPLLKLKEQADFDRQIKLKDWAQKTATRYKNMPFFREKVKIGFDFMALVLAAEKAQEELYSYWFTDERLFSDALSILERIDNVFDDENEIFILEELLDILKKEKLSMNENVYFNKGFDHFIFKDLFWQDFKTTIYELAMLTDEQDDYCATELNNLSDPNKQISYTRNLQFLRSFCDTNKGFFNSYLTQVLRSRIKEINNLGEIEVLNTNYLAIIISILQIDHHLKSSFSLSQSDVSKLLIHICRVNESKNTDRNFQKALSNYRDPKVLTNKAYEFVLDFFETHKLKEAKTELEKIKLKK